MAFKVSLEDVRVFEGVPEEKTCKIEERFLSEKSVPSCKTARYHIPEGTS